VPRSARINSASSCLFRPLRDVERVTSIALTLRINWLCRGPQGRKPSPDRLMVGYAADPGREVSEVWLVADANTNGVHDLEVPLVALMEATCRARGHATF